MIVFNHPAFGTPPEEGNILSSDRNFVKVLGGMNVSLTK
jgi:hypothetical protein